MKYVLTVLAILPIFLSAAEVDEVSYRKGYEAGRAACAPQPANKVLIQTRCRCDNSAFGYVYRIETFNDGSTNEKIVSPRVQLTGALSDGKFCSNAIRTYCGN